MSPLPGASSTVDHNAGCVADRVEVEEHHVERGGHVRVVRCLDCDGRRVTWLARPTPKPVVVEDATAAPTLEAYQAATVDLVKTARYIHSGSAHRHGEVWST